MFRQWIKREEELFRQEVSRNVGTENEHFTYFQVPSAIKARNYERYSVYM